MNMDEVSSGDGPGPLGQPPDAALQPGSEFERTARRAAVRNRMKEAPSEASGYVGEESCWRAPEACSPCVASLIFILTYRMAAPG